MNVKELYLYSPLWAFVACCRVNFTFIIRHVRKIAENDY